MMKKIITNQIPDYEISCTDYLIDENGWYSSLLILKRSLAINNHYIMLWRFKDDICWSKTEN